MGLKDAVRMVELGGRTEQHDAVRSSIGVQAVADSFRGCYIAGQVRFFSRSRSPPTPPGPGGSGNTNGARY